MMANTMNGSVPNIDVNLIPSLIIPINHGGLCEIVLPPVFCPRHAKRSSVPWRMRRKPQQRRIDGSTEDLLGSSCVGEKEDITILRSWFDIVPLMKITAYTQILINRYRKNCSWGSALALSRPKRRLVIPHEMCLFLSGVPMTTITCEN